MAATGKRATRRRYVQLATALAFFVLSLGIVGGIAYFMLTRPGQLDARMCPKDGPVGHTVVLIDTTDPFTFTQKEAFSVLFKDLVERQTPEGQLLSLFVLGESFQQNAKPVVELCNPGNEKGKTELTANLQKLRRTYEQDFLQPLERQAEQLVGTQPAKFSPILEMLQLVSINGFRREDVRGERRLVVLSDMLHNTPQFSMYKQVPDYGSFAATPYGQKTQLQMEGVKVELHYLMNTPALQTRKNLQFWEEHFKKAGARIVAVRPLEG